MYMYFSPELVDKSTDIVDELNHLEQNSDSKRIHLKIIETKIMLNLVKNLVTRV